MSDALIVLHTAIAKIAIVDRKSGSAGMPRPISYAVFCLKKRYWATARTRRRASGGRRRTPGPGPAPAPGRAQAQPRGRGAPTEGRRAWSVYFFFFNDPPPTDLYPLSQHHPLPI